jgi:hypothetical protein
MTGKIREVYNHKAMTGKDYSEYEIYGFNKDDLTYHRGYYKWFLLKKKTPIESVDENKFFDPSMVKSHMKN